jgi:hypothetical protein
VTKGERREQTHDFNITLEGAGCTGTEKVVERKVRVVRKGRDKTNAREGRYQHRDGQGKHIAELNR